MGTAYCGWSGGQPDGRCVNLPLHHKVWKFSSGIGSPGWSQKKGRKTVVVVFPVVLALLMGGNNHRVGEQ